MFQASNRNRHWWEVEECAVLIPLNEAARPFIKRSFAASSLAVMCSM